MPLQARQVLEFRREFQLAHPLPDDFGSPAVHLVGLERRVLQDVDLVVALHHPDPADQRGGVEELRVGVEGAVFPVQVYRQQVELQPDARGLRVAVAGDDPGELAWGGKGDHLGEGALHARAQEIATHQVDRVPASGYVEVAGLYGTGEIEKVCVLQHDDRVEAGAGHLLLQPPETVFQLVLRCQSHATPCPFLMSRFRKGSRKDSVLLRRRQQGQVTESVSAKPIRRQAAKKDRHNPG